MRLAIPADRLEAPEPISVVTIELDEAELDTLHRSVDDFYDYHAEEGTRSRSMIVASGALAMMRSTTLESGQPGHIARWVTPDYEAIGTALTYSIVGDRNHLEQQRLSRTVLTRALADYDLRQPLSTAIHQARYVFGTDLQTAHDLLSRANDEYDQATASEGYIFS